VELNIRAAGAAIGIAGGEENFEGIIIFFPEGSGGSLNVNTMKLVPPSKTIRAYLKART